MSCLQWWLVLWLSLKATYAIEKAHWRLVCTSGTTNWDLCSVDPYSDKDCEYSLLFSLLATSFSENATDYDNLCTTNCIANQGYVEYQFIEPVDVLCMRLNSQCASAVSCATMSLQYSTIGMIWEEYASFTQSTTLNVCEANPSVDSCTTPSDSTAPIPALTVAPTPAYETSVTLLKVDLYAWDASQSTWVGLHDATALDTEHPVSVRLHFSDQVHPVPDADAYLQITKGVRAPHVDSFPIPPGKMDVKSFPARMLDSSSTYVFYIAKNEMRDAADRPLPRIHFTFTTGLRAPVVLDTPHKVQTDSKEPEFPFAIVGGASAVAAIILAVAAHILWERRRRHRMSYRVYVAPHFVVNDDLESPREAVFVDAARRRENGSFEQEQRDFRYPQPHPSAPKHDRPKEFSKDDFNTGRPGMWSRSTSNTRREKFEKKRSSSFCHERDQPQPILSEGDQIARETAELAKDFQRKKADPIEARKKDFKFLLLRWHPDKNGEDKELATKVFQYIQEQKGWYLS